MAVVLVTRIGRGDVMRGEDCMWLGDSGPGVGGQCDPRAGETLGCGVDGETRWLMSLFVGGVMQGVAVQTDRTTRGDDVVTGDRRRCRGSFGLRIPGARVLGAYLWDTGSIDCRIT